MGEHSMLALQLPLVFVPAPVELPLSNGMVAIVDAADAEWLSCYRWRALQVTRTWYAVRNERKRLIYMHREIMHPPAGLIVDHINRNGLDNRRCNLRLVTRSQNNMHAAKREGCSSSYKGVDWQAGSRKWRARIKAHGRHIYLGMYETEIEAALAYDAAAIIYHGRFAVLNFPQGENDYADIAFKTLVAVG